MPAKNTAYPFQLTLFSFLLYQFASRHQQLKTRVSKPQVKNKAESSKCKFAAPYRNSPERQMSPKRPSPQNAATPRIFQVFVTKSKFRVFLDLPMWLNAKNEKIFIIYTFFHFLLMRLLTRHQTNGKHDLFILFSHYLCESFY